jgi:L-asparaginase
MGNSETSYFKHTALLKVPVVVVQGGAGSYLQTTSAQQRRERAQVLVRAAQAGMAVIRQGGACQAVLAAVAVLEREERFNAGRGSRLQQDGHCRVSASIMDGTEQRLSAIYNAQNCLHPSRLAFELQGRGDRNLDGEGSKLLMEELGWQPEELRTEKNIERWRAHCEKGAQADADSAIGDAGKQGLSLAQQGALPIPKDLRAEGGSSTPALPEDDDRYGTVGAVALDEKGRLWACTSTGGRGHERLGRVSDTPTPAGNYACSAVALSATGFGEQIIDLNVCGRIATRSLDGLSLDRALERTFDEVVAHQGLMGVIALSAQGVAGYAYSTEACGVAWIDGKGQNHIDPHGR